jgi:hypothetical protein
VASRASGRYRSKKWAINCRKAVQEYAAGHVFGQQIKSLPALGLVLPDNALVPIDLVLDPVLKYATRLGELSNNLVATLSFAISAKTGRKVQGLPDGKFMRSHVLLHQAERPRLGRRSAPFKPMRPEG